MTWKVCEEARKNIIDETGAKFLCNDEIEAKRLVEYLNKKEEENEPSKRVVTIPYDEKMDLHNDFLEWNELNDWLLKTGKRLIELEEIYNEDFKIELKQAIEDKIDFKKIYGGNTEKTRKQYVDEQLSDIVEEKKMLKLNQSDDLRRIEFLKKLISMKLKVLNLNEGVEIE